MKRLLLFSILSICCFTLSAQNFLWVKKVGPPSESGASSGNTNIAIDADGNIYSKGLFSGTVDFDPGSDVFNLTSEGEYPNTFILKIDVDGNFVWAKKIKTDYGAGKIVVDDSGTVYLNGIFNGTVDFDPGPNVYEMTASQSQQNNIFLLKLNSNGDFVWAKQFKSSSFCFSPASCIDSSGNIYTTFRAYGTVDMDPGENVFSLTSTGNFDVFISKLDSQGDFIWGKQFKGEDYNTRSDDFSIATDPTGNLYLAGAFYGTVDFDPGPDVFNLTPNYVDVIVVKLDTDGNLVWAKQFTGPPGNNMQMCRTIQLNSNGEIYVAGSFSGTADFDPGESSFNLNTSGLTDSDIFICKLGNSGNFMWAKQIGNTTQDEDVAAITVDVSGNVFATGFFKETVDFDPGPDNFELISNGGTDIFIFKLDNFGDFNWALNIGSESSDSGRDIKLDPSGNICVTGGFRGTVDFDPGPDVFNLISEGSYSNGFILKLSNEALSIIERNLLDLIVYPNPSNGNFTVDLGKEYTDVTVQVYNMLGQIISSEIYSSAKTIEKNINASEGIYFVKVSTPKEGSSTLQIIKQ